MFYPLIISAQDTIDYFGQIPPADSAEKFAPGIISKDNRYESNLVFSPDGKECLLQIFDGAQWSWADIYYSKYDSTWSNFERAEFIETSKYLELNPIFSPSGNTLYYSSLFPYEGYTSSTMFVDIWKVERDSSGWKDPVKLNSIINSANDDDTSPTITIDGTLYFSKDYSQEIWYSKLEDGEYKNIEKIEAPVNSGAYEGLPYVAPDESYMIFASTRSGGLGQEDLYISYRNENKKWTNPKNLGSKINSDEREQGPQITPDGKYLFFNRFQRNSYSDIYWVKADFIEKLKLTNYKPYVYYNIPDLLAKKDSVIHYIIPDSVFFDDDGIETLTLSAHLRNGEALPDWLSFDTVANILFGTPNELGSYDIMITATDTAGATISDVFKLTINYYTGIHSGNGMKNEIIVFPNPSGNKIYINYPESIEITNYILSDLNGKSIKHGQLKSNMINLSGIKIGTYMLYIANDVETIVKKIVIKY